MDPITSAGGGLTVETYANRKRFSVERLAQWGVVTARNPYAAESAVAMPYYDHSGHLVRVKYRTSRGTVWDRQQGVKPILYELERLRRVPASEPVILVEGESDVHACSHHSTLALGLPGCSMWSSAWSEYLRGRDVFIWKEPDMGGARMVAALAADLPASLVVRSTQDKDLADLHWRVGDAFRIEARALLDSALPIVDVLDSLPVDPAANVRKERRGKPARWRDDYRPRSRSLLDELPTERARDVSIVTVVERLGLEPRRRGVERVVCCSFHDDQRPSLRMNEAKGTWYCDPCGIGGDSLDFVMRVRGVSFPDAVREVAKW